MRVFGLLLPAQLSEVALLVVRVIVGIIIAAHGWQKLAVLGSANFGQTYGSPSASRYRAR
jgi:uncharacterized membrane protein YphA (DoxX/SURF4 family)